MKYIHYAFLCLGFLLFSCKKNNSNNPLTATPHVKQILHKQGADIYKEIFYYNSEGNIVKDSLFKNNVYKGGIFYSYIGDSIFINNTIPTLGNKIRAFLLDKNKLATKAIYYNFPMLSNTDTFTYNSERYLSSMTKYTSSINLLIDVYEYSYHPGGIKKVYHKTAFGDILSQTDYGHIADTLSTIENINFGKSWLGIIHTNSIYGECYSDFNNSSNNYCINYKYLLDSKKRTYAKIEGSSDTTFYTYY